MPDIALYIFIAAWYVGYVIISTKRAAAEDQRDELLISQASGPTYYYDEFDD